MIDEESDFEQALHLLHRGNAARARAIAERFAASDDRSDQQKGFTLLGYIYEDGGRDVDVDLVRALDFFHQSALRLEYSISYLSMARVSIKLGDFDGAMKSLIHASQLEDRPEVMLGFATYYKSVRPADPLKSKRYYLMAARRGALTGLMGYSAVCRQEGEWFRAVLADCARVLLAFPVAFFMREKTVSSF